MKGFGLGVGVGVGDWTGLFATDGFELQPRKQIAASEMASVEIGFRRNFINTKTIKTWLLNQESILADRSANHKPHFLWWHLLDSETIV
ncbi:MAG: hypothetical protein KA368_10870 [Acidobacteria bacterium]|nr:hypothetical protein [Acidobacteriota bacterium]